jgi:hypothetical protein
VANDKSVGEVLRELRDLLVSYARQETVEPLSRLKHYLGFGIPGALAMSLGLLFVSLGILRGLQHISWTTTGFGSLVPYVAMGVFLAVVLLVCYFKIRSSMSGRGVGPSGAESGRNLDDVSEVSSVS